MILKYKCKECDGSGLYVGMAERDGSAVVCHDCKGTGQAEFEYEEFHGRQKKDNAKRVYHHNPGIVIGEGKGKFKLEDFGGMPVEDWLEGKPFPKGHEMRKFVCPAWYYYKQFFPACSVNIGARYSDCSKFHEKEKCWKFYDMKGGEGE